MPLNDTEHFVLLALLRFKDGAYAVPIRAEIEELAGRTLSITAVYAALDRMEREGLVKTWLSDPVPERGGRARKLYGILPAGVAALKRERSALERMWEDLPARTAWRKS